MKRAFYKNRIAILTVLAGLAYVFMIGSRFSSAFESALLGWHLADDKPEATTPGGSYEVSEVYYVNVFPRGDVLKFPEQIAGVGSKSYDARFSSIKVALPEDADLPGGVRRYEITQEVIFFLLLVLYIILPFRFFGLLSALKSNDIFTRANVKSIRKIGWILIALYFLELLANQLDKKINQLLFEFSDYAIWGYSADSILLLLGVVVLLVGEVLARGVLIEEDRQLTI